MTFEQWMKELDKYLLKHYNTTSDSLEGMNYRAAFHNRETIKQAAESAIEAAADY